MKDIKIIFIALLFFNLDSHYTNQAYVNSNESEVYYLKESCAKRINKKDGYQGSIKGLKKSRGWGWRDWYSYYTPKYSATYKNSWYIEGYYYPWWYYGYLPYYYWWY